LEQARGVFDSHQRQQLVSVAQQLVTSAQGADGGVAGLGGVGGGSGRPLPEGLLPGVPTTWDIYSASPEVWVP
jgi:hypothetical protein